MSEVASAMVLGLGGGAGKIIKQLAGSEGTDWLRLVAVDTDEEDTPNLERVTSVTVGGDWTQGYGCGGNAELGRKVLGKEIGIIREQIKDVDLLLVIGCLGRGTASGGVQAIADLAREEAKLAFFFVTTPFAVEGNARRSTAEVALKQLRGGTDVLISLSSDLLFTQFPADTGISEAFALADRFIAQGVLGIAEIMRCRGTIPIDFANLKALLAKREAECSLGLGKIPVGSDDPTQLVQQLYESPMLGGDEVVKKADVVVATLAGPNLSLGVMNSVLQALQARIGTSAKSIVGVSEDSGGSDWRLTMLTIRYAKTGQSQPAAAVKAVQATQPATKASRRTKAKASGEKQIDLPFVQDHLSLGIFGNATATMHNGENLDIPTFQRRGIVLDVGD
jgi:cell division protein FtsZ